jgi:DNA replication protein DnaC
METFNSQQTSHMIECGILQKWHTKNLGDYTLDPKNKVLMQRYVNDSKTPLSEGIGYYMYGSNGVGKTLCLNSVFKELMLKGHSVRIISFSALVDMYVSAWRDDAKKIEFSSIVKKPQFLAIEELGKEYANRKDDNENFVNTCLDLVIKTRIQIGKPIWFTSNVPPDSIRTLYTEDIASMLLESCVPIKFVGDDYRRTILKSNKEKYL